MVMWAMIVAEAPAAPTAELCEQWRTSLAAQAQTLAAAEHTVDGPNVRVSSARVRFDDLTARLENGVCRIRAAGNVDLTGQVQVALYGMQTACPVRLAKAPVVTELEIQGSRATPKILRSLADLDGLKQRMSLCVDLPVIKGFVVDIANDWVRRQLPTWHGAIETSLQP